MATEQDNGGPAFPVHEQWNEWSELKADYVPRTGLRGGMSLRDYFASAAIGAVVAFEDRGLDIADPLPYEAVARCAYQIADAMLKERAK